ncbi:MAG: hydroxymethylglutaryl-CoA lyase [Bacteroidetes bacterium]|jgi:hydroxymethylglutaryl-CoA lyase|nr:hydroxymethylglutaryl-CoA lyase [Bacteroidota bacterium]
MSFPDRVHLCEVGPRDGFQFEDTFIPTDRKIEAIDRLAAAGLRRIQVTSFVHPDWVPQMADAEAVCAGLPTRSDVLFTGLALNLKGVERASKNGLKVVDLSIATHDTHSRANANMPLDEAIAQGEAMVKRAQALGMQAQMNLQTVFGYRDPGDTPVPHVVDMAERFADLGLESLALSDSTGMADPVMIRERVEAVQAVIGDTPLVLHLHDTRGSGIANMMTALQCGVTRFDTSMAGMGGCPFIHGAAGNIATEDTVHLLEQMGMATGIDWRAVAEASLTIERVLRKRFPGKLHRLLQRAAEQPVA